MLPEIGLFEVVVITIVVTNLFITLFSDEVKKAGKLRWLLLIILAIPIATHQIMIVRSPEYYLYKARLNLQKAQEKMDPDNPAIEDIKKIQSNINTIAAYTARRAERYKRIFEEQKARFGFHFKRFEAALKLRKSGKINEAIKILKEIIAKCPDFYLAYYNLGLAYESLGDLESAELYYARAAQLEPKLNIRDPSIYNTYGFLLLRLHKFEEAEKAYLKALALDPKHPKAKIGLEAARKKVMF